MGDQPPAVYEFEDAALNARIAQTDDGYDGKYGNLIGYWFEMILPGHPVPFLGKARVEPVVSRVVGEEMGEKGIKRPYLVPELERALEIKLVAENGFLLECREFRGNWQDFTLDELKLVRNAFVRLYFIRSEAVNKGKIRYIPRPEIDGIDLAKIVFKPLGWPKELESTISTVEVLK